MSMTEIFALFLLIPGIVLAVNPTNNNGHAQVDVEGHLLQLEQAVEDLRSQSTAQEQKYAAVLSSVLSKLTSTTDELNDMKVNLTTVMASYKILQDNFDQVQQKLKENDEEMIDLRSELNASRTEIQALHSSHSRCESEITVKTDIQKANADIKELTTRIGHAESELKTCKRSVEQVDAEIVALHVSQNSTWKDVKIIQSSLADISTKQLSWKSVLNLTSYDVSQIKRNITTISQRIFHNNGRVQPIIHQFNTRQRGVRMEGLVTSSDGVVQKETIWKTSMYKGHDFNNTTGYFTAPVNGSYIFWVNAFAELPNHDSSVSVYIKTDEDIIVGVAYGISSGNSTYTPVTGIGVTYLQQGRQVWFTPSVDVKFLSNVSRFGGALL